MQHHSTLSRMLVKIADLQPFPGNARVHADEALVESLEANGQYRPVVVNKPTMQILAGNGTVAAAKALGWEKVAATFVEVDEVHARRIVLVDNRLNDLASYDNRALVALLETVETLDGTGYDEQSMADLIGELARLDAEQDGTTDPYGEWDGMPDYQQDDRQSVFHCTVHFLTADDADAFFRSIDRPKKAVLWWPRDDGLHSSGKVAYVADDGAMEGEIVE